MRRPIDLIIPTTDRDAGLEAWARATEKSGVTTYGNIPIDERGEGYTRTVNRALRQARDGGHDACVMVDDCRPVSNNWLSILQGVLTHREDVWFVGPSGPCRTPPQNTGRPHDGRAPQYVSHVAGFCWVIRWEALDVLGLLNERFAHYGSDVDYQWQGRELGKRAVWVPFIYVDHELHEPREPWWTEDNETFDALWT